MALNAQENLIPKIPSQACGNKLNSVTLVIKPQIQVVSKSSILNIVPKPTTTQNFILAPKIKPKLRKDNNVLKINALRDFNEYTNSHTIEKSKIPLGNCKIQLNSSIYKDLSLECRTTNMDSLNKESKHTNKKANGNSKVNPDGDTVIKTRKTSQSRKISPDLIQSPIIVTSPFSPSVHSYTQQSAEQISTEPCFRKVLLVPNICKEEKLHLHKSKRKTGNTLNVHKLNKNLLKESEKFPAGKSITNLIIPHNKCDDFISKNKGVSSNNHNSKYIPNPVESKTSNDHQIKLSSIVIGKKEIIIKGDVKKKRFSLPSIHANKPPPILNKHRRHSSPMVGISTEKLDKSKKSVNFQKDPTIYINRKQSIALSVAVKLANTPVTYTIHQVTAPCGSAHQQLRIINSVRVRVCFDNNTSPTRKNISHMKYQQMLTINSSPLTRKKHTRLREADDIRVTSPLMLNKDLSSQIPVCSYLNTNTDILEVKYKSGTTTCIDDRCQAYDSTKQENTQACDDKLSAIAPNSRVESNAGICNQANKLLSGVGVEIKNSKSVDIIENHKCDKTSNAQNILKGPISDGNISQKEENVNETEEITIISINNKSQEILSPVIDVKDQVRLKIICSDIKKEFSEISNDNPNFLLPQLISVQPKSEVSETKFIDSVDNKFTMPTLESENLVVNDKNKDFNSKWNISVNNEQNMLSTESKSYFTNTGTISKSESENSVNIPNIESHSTRSVRPKQFHHQHTETTLLDIRHLEPLPTASVIPHVTVPIKCLKYNQNNNDNNNNLVQIDTQPKRQISICVTDFKTHILNPLKSAVNKIKDQMESINLSIDETNCNSE